MYELRTKRTKEERDLGFCFVFHAVLVVVYICMMCIYVCIVVEEYSCLVCIARESRERGREREIC